MPSWPVAAATVMRDGYEESPPDNVIRTPMDLGPGKERKRSTAAPRPLRFQVKITKTDVATIDAWFQDDIAAGALAFDWTHPRTGDSCSMKFNAPPKYVPLGGDHWVAQLDVRVLV